MIQPSKKIRLVYRLFSYQTPLNQLKALAICWNAPELPRSNYDPLYVTVSSLVADLRDL